MRLNEHRMTSAKGMNIDLQHVTILEEAHNILKRTSGESNPEGSNLTAKSVEMLSNAMAEMRTYGEGFIIADQSPSAVDVSAIRNTNTKIIMRLPDENDRRLAGKSAALKDEQLDEIAKLPKGVAVVYQNDWLEPVLCKIKKYSGTVIPYHFIHDVERNTSAERAFKSELLKLLLKDRLYERVDVDVDLLEKLTPLVEISTKNKLEVTNLLREYKRFESLSIWKECHFDILAKTVFEFLDVDAEVMKLTREAKDFSELNCGFQLIIEKSTGELSADMLLAVSQCIMKEFSTAGEDNLRLYVAWREDIVAKGGLL